MDDAGRELAVCAARAAADMKAVDVSVLDVGDILAITGFFVIVSGTNPRHVGAIVEHIEAKVKAQFARSPVRIEGAREQQWTLIDYGDVIVHVFLESIREFYEIERLYLDAPAVAWDPTAE